MDVDMLRSLFTALAFCCFLAIALWAYSQGARKGFDEAALLPFSEDDAASEQDVPLNQKG